MTKIEMSKDFQKKFREYRLKKRDELDREISNILSKYAYKIGGGFLILGIIIGRISK